MKTLTVMLLSLFLTSFAGGGNDKAAKEPEATVLICTGKYSKRYHNSMCQGMNACKGEQKKVSLTTAKKMGLTPCGICYK
ncbi:MAG: hypothetical protein LBR26_15945 [Prevotella sp.]|jgi:trimethylamine:corrinoid methyltransferase-like protein|nr:hypothetical protein [Prevotella sp.]